jgi:hypothetical protein
MFAKCFKNDVTARAEEEMEVDQVTVFSDEKAGTLAQSRSDVAPTPNNNVTSGLYPRLLEMVDRK